ncbi:MAG: urea transporter [Pseudomonadota bacterium]
MRLQTAHSIPICCSGIHMGKIQFPGLSRYKTSTNAIVDSVLNGIAQIYFQPSKLTGAVLLFALYATRPALALAALAGVAIANLSAHALHLPRQRIRDGLYGYNAALSCTGLCALYLPADFPDSLAAIQPHASLLVWMAAASIAGMAATHALLRWNRLPALTLPFVATMLLAALLGEKTGLLLQAVPAATGARPLIEYQFYALAQASFIGSAPLGMLVLAALAAYRWHEAVWALLGAGLAWCALTAASAQWLEAGPYLQQQAIGVGLNCALAAQGLTVHRRSWSWRLAGIAVTISLGTAFAMCGFACFTLPFVLASWMAMQMSTASAENRRASLVQTSPKTRSLDGA